jgi:hypothetical protein
MIYYAQGSAIVSAEEMFEPSVVEAVSDFHSALAAGKKPHAVVFSSGELTSGNAVRSIAAGPGVAPIEFERIGLGLPLTIMIREVYTGKYPKGGLFSGGKDMLLTSAIKSIVSFEAKPRAINFLKNKVPSKNRMSRPPATQQGTPIIFYSPALLERSMTLDLTMVFDTFPQEVFDQVGDSFTAAAGIPIFQVASTYLLGAGMITKLVGKAGEAIFDGEPVFDSSDSVDISLPGTSPIPPGFALITSDNIDSIDKDFRSKHHVNASGQVVDDEGKEYDGDVPYVVISLDGTPVEEFASFSPNAASAAILSRFFGIKDGQHQPLSVVIDAIKVYSDLTYRRQVDRIDEQLKALPEGDSKKKPLEEKRKALVENILEDILKPKGA